MIAAAAAQVTRKFMVRRPRLIVAAAVMESALFTVSDMTPRQSTARNRPDQKLSQNIDDDGHNEEGQTHFNQSTEVEVARGLAEFIGNHAGHGVAGGKQRARNLWTIADDHGDGHSLAQSAAQPENHGTEDSRPGIA